MLGANRPNFHTNGMLKSIPKCIILQFPGMSMLVYKTLTESDSGNPRQSLQCGNVVNMTHNLYTIDINGSIQRLGSALNISYIVAFQLHLVNLPLENQKQKQNCY